MWPTRPCGDAGGVHFIIQADAASRRGLIQALDAVKILAALLMSMTVWPSMASACQFYTPSPDVLVEESKNLVIAHPVAISNVPKVADDPSYRGEFRQTILWEVVVGWKGKLKPGDRFTTRRMHNRSGMCSPGAGNYSGDPLLITFSGDEPYAEFDEYSIELHRDLFKGVQDLLIRRTSN